MSMCIYPHNKLVVTALNNLIFILIEYIHHVNLNISYQPP